MDDSSKSNIKASYTITDASHKNPLKKVHCVANKLFVVIDEEIAKHLGISETDSWLEQILTEDGILLQKYHYELPASTNSSSTTISTTYNIIDAKEAKT